MTRKLDFTGPVEIAPDIFWVGHEREGDKFQCHAYLIRNGKDSVLIDPGSKLTWDATRDKILQLMPLDHIRYLICHHQDPDIVGCVETLLEERGRDDIEIVTHWRSKTLLVHHDWRIPFYLIEQNQWQLDLNGRILRFIFLPYLHFAGCFATLDVETGVLFSSDLFGGFTEEFNLYATDVSYFECMRPFHEDYLPSNDVLNHGIQELERHDFRMIAPQHGSIIPEHLVAPIMEKLKELECGLYMLPVFQENIDRMLALGRLFRKLMERIRRNVRLGACMTAVTGFFSSFEQFRGMAIYTWDSAGNLLLMKGTDNPEMESLNSRVSDLRTNTAIEPVFHEEGSLELKGVLSFPGLDAMQTEVAVVHSLQDGDGRLTGVVIIFLKDEEVSSLFLRFLDELALPLGLLTERERLYRDVTAERDKYYQKAVSDSLTGLFNRHYLAVEGSKEVQKAIRYQYPLSGILLDIDHFKQINDSFGHVAGDVVLEEMGSLLRSTVRDLDVPVRYGGEEFLILLPHGDLVDVTEVAERLRQQVEDHTFRFEETGIQVTISLGVDAVEDGDTLASLIKRIDDLLYQAKNRGRNRVVSRLHAKGRNRIGKGGSE